MIRIAEENGKLVIRIEGMRIGRGPQNTDPPLAVLVDIDGDAVHRHGATFILAHNDVDDPDMLERYRAAGVAPPQDEQGHIITRLRYKHEPEVAVPRPEWVKCALTGRAKEKLTWCGRQPEPFEWCFAGAGHVALNGADGDRLALCSDCCGAIVQAMCGAPRS